MVKPHLKDILPSAQEKLFIHNDNFTNSSMGYSIRKRILLNHNRPGNSEHNTTTRHEYEFDTTRKITKTRQKTRHGQKNEHDTKTQIS